ncbi:hypothetical protein Tco_1306354 [Tanacetum coccineum]
MTGPTGTNNASKHSTVSNVNPSTYYTTVSPCPIYYPPTAEFFSPLSHIGPLLGFGYTLAPQTGPAHYFSPVVNPVLQAQAGSHAATIGSVGPTVAPERETTLPHAFTARTLHDPATGAWNMDTCASSHLNDAVTSLSDIFNVYLSIRLDW